jgi:hypothetical protein
MSNTGGGIWDSISRAAETFEGYFDRGIDYLTAREEFNFRSDALAAGYSDPGVSYPSSAATNAASGWTDPATGGNYQKLMLIVAVAGLALTAITFLKR